TLRIKETAAHPAHSPAAPRPAIPEPDATIKHTPRDLNTNEVPSALPDFATAKKKPSMLS
ncbi:hypothetical protein N9918_02285, partial [Akkermansiaceae bacterium]|nr:hypothetical protein [Akkermansiaceae bacterium]